MSGLDKAARFILTFHGIGEPGAHVGRDEIPYWVGEETFHEIIDFIASGAFPNLPPIEVTFDDGNMSDIRIALPALVKKGLSARFFVLAGRIGASGYLSKSDIREMSNAGMTIGSHGWSHIDWRKATDAELHRELVDAKSLIEDALGKSIDNISVPFGRYNKRVIPSILKFGYAAVFSSDCGLAFNECPTPRNTLKTKDDHCRLEHLIKNEIKSPKILLRRLTRLIKRHLI